MRNICEKRARIEALKQTLGTFQSRPVTGSTGRTVSETGGFPLAPDQAGLHDLYAGTPADAVAVNAFGLGLARQAAAERPVVWGLHAMMRQESGQPYGPGLQEMGLMPDEVLLVLAHDIRELLAIGEEALRSPATGAVLLSAWGESRALGLTASRRLALAAEAGGISVFLARAGAMPSPGAARTRWRIEAAPSTPLEGGAPGSPVFSATLLRHRGDAPSRTHLMMEWDREQRSFKTPATLSGGLVSLAAQRPVAAPRERRAA
ncbi:hypothetical protein GVN24_24000 [Rhizobium sp. CRIBSB]|nr:hypothetical protein [Rhizobium sp. CRIBSB]